MALKNSLIFIVSFCIVFVLMMFSYGYSACQTVFNDVQGGCENSTAFLSICSASLNPITHVCTVTCQHGVGSPYKQNDWYGVPSNDFRMMGTYADFCADTCNDLPNYETGDYGCNCYQHDGIGIHCHNLCCSAGNPPSAPVDPCPVGQVHLNGSNCGCSSDTRNNCNWPNEESGYENLYVFNEEDCSCKCNRLVVTDIWLDEDCEAGTFCWKASFYDPVTDTSSVDIFYPDGMKLYLKLPYVPPGGDCTPFCPEGEYCEFDCPPSTECADNCFQGSSCLPGCLVGGFIPGSPSAPVRYAGVSMWNIFEPSNAWGYIPFFDFYYDPYYSDRPLEYEFLGNNIVNGCDTWDAVMMDHLYEDYILEFNYWSGCEMQYIKFIVNHGVCPSGCEWSFELGQFDVFYDEAVLHFPFSVIDYAKNQLSALLNISPEVPVFTLYDTEIPVDIGDLTWLRSIELLGVICGLALLLIRWIT